MHRFRLSVSAFFLSTSLALISTMLWAQSAPSTYLAEVPEDEAALPDGVRSEGGKRWDAETSRTQLEFYSNPRRRFAGWIYPGSTAGIQGTDIIITNTDTVGTEIKITQGTDDNGVPIYEVESSGGGITLELGDPNRYASLLEASFLAAADYYPGYKWHKKLAWFAKIGPGYNRYPGPVSGDANKDDDGRINIPPGVIPATVTLTAKGAFKLMTACPTPEEPASCGYNGKDAVLFVHGYQAGSAITKKDYWGDFPALIESSGYIPFDFRWSTSARFQDVATELAFAIQEITAQTGKQVHVIAHSYGGLLTRTLLQGLAVGSPSVGSKVASITTLGTPHSGIMDRYKCRKGFGFPRGQDNSLAFEGCGGIPCHQMGEDVFTKLQAKFYNVKPKAGHHAYILADNLKDNTHVAKIPFQSLIGVTMKRLGNKKIDNGDDLISFEGQRFKPKYSAVSTGCESFPKNPDRVDVAFKSDTAVGPFRLTESYLGDFKSKDRPKDKLTSARGGGYRHSLGVAGADACKPQFLPLECIPESPPPAEQYVECDSTAPGSCPHDGFKKALAWIQSNSAESIVRSPAMLSFSFDRNPVDYSESTSCTDDEYHWEHLITLSETAGTGVTIETLNWDYYDSEGKYLSTQVNSAEEFADFFDDCGISGSTYVEPSGIACGIICHKLDGTDNGSVIARVSGNDDHGNDVAIDSEPIILLPPSTASSASLTSGNEDGSVSPTGGSVPN